MATAWHLPAIRLYSNCGGNNAAVAYVSEVAIQMMMFADGSPDAQFSFSTATPEQLQRLAQTQVGWGVRPGDILITTQPYRLAERDDRQIVAICNRPFTNVPQYMFRPTPPTHAVAFSDGSTILMSAREFAKLDRTSFVPVNQIASLP